jgi:DHA1 family bicyclomycin/chloramphenicol resistance-like MFS transporter
MGFREFVIIIAALMATNAIAIDAMLPALPEIGRALQVAEENRVQLVITAYLLGFGFAQIFYGPLSDRFGRRPVLLASLVAYTIFSLVAAFASHSIRWWWRAPCRVPRPRHAGSSPCRSSAIPIRGGEWRG